MSEVEILVESLKRYKLPEDIVDTLVVNLTSANMHTEECLFSAVYHYNINGVELYINFILGEELSYSDISFLLDEWFVTVRHKYEPTLKEDVSTLISNEAEVDALLSIVNECSRKLSKKSPIYEYNPRVTLDMLCSTPEGIKTLCGGTVDKNTVVTFVNEWNPCSTVGIPFKEFIKSVCIRYSIGTNIGDSFFQEISLRILKDKMENTELSIFRITDTALTKELEKIGLDIHLGSEGEYDGTGYHPIYDKIITRLTSVQKFHNREMHPTSDEAKERDRLIRSMGVIVVDDYLLTKKKWENYPNTFRLELNQYMDKNIATKIYKKLLKFAKKIIHDPTYDDLSRILRIALFNCIENSVTCYIIDILGDDLTLINHLKKWHISNMCYTPNYSVEDKIRMLIPEHIGSYDEIMSMFKVINPSWILNEGTAQSEGIMKELMLKWYSSEWCDHPEPCFQTMVDRSFTRSKLPEYDKDGYYQYIASLIHYSLPPPPNGEFRKISSRDGILWLKNMEGCTLTFDPQWVAPIGHLRRYIVV